MPIRRSYVCEKDHRTESDFTNSDAFERLEKRKLLKCECCGSTKVTAELAAPRINKGGKGSSPKAPPMENVGDRFADAMREVHEGKKPDRPFIGTATDREARGLVNDGIGPFFAVEKPRSFDA